jgi:hypothetical protein
MKCNATMSVLILSYLLLISTSGYLYGQRTTAELITTMAPPNVVTGDIPVKDGERFVTYRDGLLFAVNFWTGVQIFDVSNIEAPKRLGMLRTKDMVYHVALQDNKLFAANKTEGVIVFDIINPSRPVEIARIKTPGDAYWVNINYPLMYVAMGSEGFCVMDISNLNDVRTLSLEIPDNWVWSVLFKDNLLYVAAKQGGLIIYDATNPSNLVKLTQYKTGYQALQLQIEGSLAYLADGPGGLLILDISSPRLPKEVGRYPTSGFSRQVFKSGNYAYLANRELGLLIVNVKDPAKPTLETQYISDSETYASFKEDVYVFISTDTKTEILRHNNKPILQPIADQFIDEDSTWALQLMGSDVDGDQIYYEAKNLPEGSEFNTTTGLLTWKPTFDQSGVYRDVTFTVIERTGSKLSDSKTIDITVNHVNRMPELPAIANAEIPEDSTLTIVVPEGSDPDKEDQDKLTYRAENMPPGAQFNPATRIFTWKPTFEQSGQYIVDFVLDDGSGGSDREAVTITVLHVDRPPVIAAVSDKTVDEAQPLSIQLSGEEPDKEDQAKIQFSMFNLPTGATFDPASRTFSWTPTYDQSGLYPDIGAVMKAGVLSDTTYFQIQVNHVNRPPVLADIPNQVVDEHVPLKFSISGSDPDKEDAGKLVYTAQNLPVGATFNADSLVFSWIPTYEQSGVYPDIVFMVKDPQGLSDQKSISIAVNQVDRTPIMEPVPPLTTDENKAVTYQLASSDPDKEDAGKLVYSATDLPEGAQLDPTTGLFSWTPTYDQSGTYDIIFSVSDGNLTNSQKIDITINHVNRPPVLDPIVNQTVDENKQLTFTISGSDPDKEDVDLLTYSASNLPTGATFDPASRTFSWTPTYEQSGVYPDVLFTVADPQGLSAEIPITIKVNHVNRPPQLEAVSPITAEEKQLVSFTLKGSDPDREDTGKLRYQISNLPTGALINGVSGEFTWTPDYDQSGEYTLAAQVIDSAGTTAEQNIQITVTNVNRPPVIEALSPVTGKENTALAVRLLFSDPDKEDEGKLTVSATGLPEGAELNPITGEIKWTPTFEQSGSYAINYIVKDSFGATAEGTVTIQIENVNRPPVAPDVADMETAEDDAFRTVLPEGSDPDQEDAGKLTYSLQGLPTGATLEASTRTLSWKPTYEQAGEYSLAYIVTDVAGLTAQTSFKINVRNVNRAPVLPQVEAFTTSEGESFTTVLPPANDPDQEDAGKLSYQVNGQPSGANFNGGTRTFSWTPRYDQAGEYQATYLVKDASDASAQTNVKITVKNTNQNPVMDDIGNKTVKEGDEVSFQVKTSDPDAEDQGKLSLSANGLPAGANFSASSGNFSWIPRDNQQGSYRITFLVKDPAGASAQRTVNITVEDVPPPPEEPAPNN